MRYQFSRRTIYSFVKMLHVWFIRTLRCQEMPTAIVVKEPENIYNWRDEQNCRVPFSITHSACEKYVELDKVVLPLQKC